MANANEEAVPPPGLDPDLEKELKRRRISTEDPGAVLDGIANRIVCNEQLTAFLLTIEPNRRKDAYDALSDRLHFKVEPFKKVMLHRGSVLRNMQKRGLSFTPQRKG